MEDGGPRVQADVCFFKEKCTIDENAFSFAPLCPLAIIFTMCSCDGDTCKEFKVRLRSSCHDKCVLKNDMRKDVFRTDGQPSHLGTGTERQC